MFPFFLSIGRIIRWLLLFFLSFFYPLLSAAQDKPVVLATHNLSPLGSYQDQAKVKVIADETFTGIAVDRIRCAFTEMKQPLRILVVPWQRAQSQAETGDVDGFFAGSQNAHRDSYARMTDIIAAQKWKWYWLKSNPQEVDSDVFKQSARIAAFQGSNMSRWLKSQGYPIYSSPRTSEQLLLQLKADRVDVVMANDRVMASLLDEFDMHNEVESLVAKDKPLGVYFTKRFLGERPDILAKFNQALANCYRLEAVNPP